MNIFKIAPIQTWISIFYGGYLMAGGATLEEAFRASIPIMFWITFVCAIIVFFALIICAIISAAQDKIKLFEASIRNLTLFLIFSPATIWILWLSWSSKYYQQGIVLAIAASFLISSCGYLIRKAEKKNELH